MSRENAQRSAKDEDRLKMMLDDQKRPFLIPERVAAQYGITRRSEIIADNEQNVLSLRPTADLLAKLYIEPTSNCNLHCRTCIRNSWDEPTGMMDKETFERIIVGIEELPLRPTVFFGGFGEPLSHPQIVEMIQRVNAIGSRTELITNGTLLTEGMTRDLIQAGLDRLWVSLDGATPSSYSDVRLGAELPKVLANIECFSDVRRKRGVKAPQLGIAFVAMKRNIADLPALLRLAQELGASAFHVSHVLPYTRALLDEALYRDLVEEEAYPARDRLTVTLPRLDPALIFPEILFQTLTGRARFVVAGVPVDAGRNRCPFIEQGVAAIAWDGEMSPCLELLHTHTSFLNGAERVTNRYVIGNVQERSISDLWSDREYAAFRRRVTEFTFAPCAYCGSCSLALENGEDCYGNPAPSCGGCLWAQGLIHCP